MFKRSHKYDELISLYTQMAESGYATRAGATDMIDKAYGTQEATKFRGELKRLFTTYHIGSVLDYGAGATTWSEKEVPEGGNLLQFTGAKAYHAFEPARGKNDRQICDAVVSFDVLEHIFISDIGYVLDDIFRSATRLVVLNVACYKARALLPNGENAHITVRAPQWWRGVVEAAASQYPDLGVALYASACYGQVERIYEARFQTWIDAPGYER